MSAGLQRDVAVRLGERSYSVRIGPGLLEDAGTLLTALTHPGPTIVVTNATVSGLYGQRLAAALSAAGMPESLVIEIPDGERFKSMATVERIYDRALDHGIDRASTVVALGGGVVGDIAGFAAATLLRGLRLVMVPTTLLAQVDSSVGGKTGVNRPQGKNLVGAFYQPALVVADPTTLTTLPAREYRAGLAEVVKYAMILDAELFDLLERESDAVSRCDPVLMTDVVARCVELKAKVVERDETEGGLRRILNFGHTVGHAIEQTTGYAQYLHGEAVAMGMAAAAHLSVRRGACAAAAAKRLESLLERFGLAHEIPPELDRARLAEAITFDKKADGDTVAFIVCTAVGACREEPLSAAEIGAYLPGRA